MVHYPSIKTIQDGLNVSYSKAKMIKDAMKAETNAFIVIEKATDLMGIDIDSYPFSPMAHLYESTGLYHIDADIMTLGTDGKTLIRDRASGDWYVMTEREYKDMEITRANYNA